jgi:hypothetical protein
MEVDLNRFYLHGDKVFVFNEKGKTHYEGKSWQGGLIHHFVISHTHELLQELIPIDPIVAKIVQSGQAIDPPLV